MDLGVLALLCLTGFGAGFVDAIAGGGGLLTVPALVASGLGEHFALGTNKGQAVFGATSSVASFYRKKELNRERIPFTFAGGFLGSLLGARLLLWMRPEPLKPLVVVLLIVAVALVLAPKPRPKTDEELALLPRARPLALLGFTLVLGAYDGFFGPGTGSILIAGFMTFFGDRATRASGNAKVANFASNVAATLTMAFSHKILWGIALPMAAANALGAFVGARVAIRGGDRFVRMVVVLVVAALMVKIIWGFLHK